jgi:hypothetical protein
MLLSTHRTLAAPKAQNSSNYFAIDCLTHPATDVTRKGVSSHA